MVQLRTRPNRHWKFKFNFLGMYYPAGYYYNGKVYPSIAAMPAEDLAKLAQVQYGSMSAPANLGSAYYNPPPVQSWRLWCNKICRILASKTTSNRLLDAPSILRKPRMVANPRQLALNWIVGGGSNWPASTNIYMNNYGFVPYVQAPTSAHVAWKRQGAMGASLAEHRDKSHTNCLLALAKLAFQA